MGMLWEGGEGGEMDVGVGGGLVVQRCEESYSEHLIVIQESVHRSL